MRIKDEFCIGLHKGEYKAFINRGGRYWILSEDLGNYYQEIIETDISEISDIQPSYYIDNIVKLAEARQQQYLAERGFVKEREEIVLQVKEKEKKIKKDLSLF